MKSLTVILLAMLMTSQTFAKSLKLENTPAGTVMATIKAMTIPANAKSMTLYQDSKIASNVNVPFKWEIVFHKKSNQLRNIKAFKQFNVTYVTKNLKNCYTTSGIDYYSVKIYVDDDQIEYIKYSSGIFSKKVNKCLLLYGNTNALKNSYDKIGIGILAMPN